ncbi:MAG: hypothetical protein WA584_14895 [Pyrinomonadaceae bacterium]
MKNLIAFAILLVSAFAISAQERTFLQKIEGKWEGTLEYSDYKTEKRVSLKTTLEIKASADGKSAEFFYVYDDFGKIIKETDEVRIDPVNKKFYFGEDEFSLEESGGKLVLFGKQIDNDKPEPVRKTIIFTVDSLQILKETRTPFQFRNVYNFKRVGGDKDKCEPGAIGSVSR